jgi:hypothetical protein
MYIGNKLTSRSIMQTCLESTCSSNYMQIPTLLISGLYQLYVRNRPSYSEPLAPSHPHNENESCVNNTHNVSLPFGTGVAPSMSQVPLMAVNSLPRGSTILAVWRPSSLDLLFESHSVHGCVLSYDGQETSQRQSSCTDHSTATVWCTTTTRKEKFSLCLTNQALRHEGVWGSGFIDPHSLDLGTSWWRVVSFTPLTLYPWGNSPRYALYRRLGGPQSRSGRCGKKKILDPTGTRTPTRRSCSP